MLALLVVLAAALAFAPATASAATPPVLRSEVPAGGGRVAERAAEAGERAAPARDRPGISRAPPVRPEDELVPVTGAIKQAERLRELGYRYRLHLFGGQEHYGPPVVDQWAEGVAYEHRFVRDPNPAQVTYVRSMPFEHAVEQVNGEGLGLDFSFDHAYWMSGLEPVDASKGVARFDGRSLAIRQRAHSLVPEAGGPTADQTGPYAMEGQAWQDDPTAAPAAPRNAFTATLTGARAVTLDPRRMRLDRHRTIEADITTEAPLRLTLTGAKRVTIDVPAGHHTVAITPAGRRRRA